MTLENRIVGMIGIAKRGKYISYGEDIVFKLKKRKIRLIIIAEDCPAKVHNELERFALEDNATTIVFMNKVSLGQAIGIGPVNALGILNSGIAVKIEELREEIETNGKEKQ